MSPPYYWPPDAREHWPLNVPAADDRSTFLKLFQQQGYEACPSAELEPGYEKVALYVDSKGKTKHAARQLRSGMWTSKLGQSVDIAHTLKGIEGERYGHAEIIMRRLQSVAPAAPTQRPDGTPNTGSTG